MGHKHAHPHTRVHTHARAIPRRHFLTAAVGTAAGLATGLSGRRAFASTPTSTEREQAGDVLIRGGRVVDPSQELSGRYDVGIRDGRIAEVAQLIDPAGWREVIEADGRIVTPGFIDLHAHVFEGVSHYGINADKYCLSRGSTTVLDLGSAGAQTFPSFRKNVIEVQATRIRALLNISVTGMLTNLRGELQDLEYANVNRAVQTIEQHRDVILGVKVRAGSDQSGPNDLIAVERALEVAEAVGLPMMMHIASTVTPIDELLRLLRPGDLLTHSFRRSGTPESGDDGILTSEGILRTSAGDALERGVLFDVGHGQGSFSFDTMEMAMRQGVLPSTISSDLHAYNVGEEGPVYDLATTISKFLYLGFSLEEAVRRTTATPAAAIGWDVQIGTLRVGAEGDVAIFEMQTGEHRFVDSYGAVRIGREKLVPWRTIKGGRTYLPQW